MGTEFTILECTNPGCQLRFPVISVKSTRWCPICKSKLEIDCKYSESSPVSENQNPQHSFKTINLFLDNIRSAYNVGSILRTTDGFNIKHLFFSGITPTPDNPKVIKTSLGAETSVKWSSHNNGLNLATKLKNEGFYLIGLENCKGSTPITSIENNKWKNSVVLIIGNEIAGIDPKIREICNDLVHIPMVGKKSSFNVTIAFGITAFYLNYIFRI